MLFQPGNEVYKRMTRFWGKLFLINFANSIIVMPMPCLPRPSARIRLTR